MSACPVCRTEAAQPFFAQEGVPVFSNVLHATAEAARAAPRGDVALAACAACGMVWNTAFDPGLVGYSPAYDASLHFSPRFQEYARELTAGLVARHALRGKTIVEIGCGKGEFLEMLCASGAARGIGFDKSFDGEPRPGIEVIRESYGSKHAEIAADLVCCRHVLEHVAEPRAFLELVRRAARRPGCAVFFEVPNALWTLRDLGVWDVIYEHCSYFTPAALRRLFVECGFEVTTTWTAFGDQFLGIEGVRGSGLQAAATSSTAASAGTGPAEDAAGAAEVTRLAAAFDKSFRQKVARWRDELATRRARNQRLALWGAGSKGVSFLNTVPGSEAIGCAVDRNPRKRGRHVPGSGHPVRSPDDLRAFRPDAVLVMNPVYESEIAAQCAELGLQPELLRV